MPAPITITSSRAAVNGPLENEVVNYPVLLAGIQAVANRSEWNKTSLFVAGNSSIAGTGSYPAETTWTTVNRSGIDASFTLSVNTGDIVFVRASGDWQPQAVDSYFAVRLYDGTNVLDHDTAYNGAAWSANTIRHFKLDTVYIAASSGSVTFSLQTQRGANVMTVTQATGRLSMGYIHAKLGAA